MSNTLHNAIMEAGSKDHPPMLAPGNYVQWKSRIKRYTDTKPNHKLIHYCLENPPYELGWKDKEVPTSKGSLVTRTERVNETYKNVLQDIRDQLNAKAEAVQIILTEIDNDIYSTVDACLNACEIWKAIEMLKQEPYYSRFYKMMNKLIKNQCKVTNHQVNVQFLLQLQPEWQRFVTLVKQSQELKTVSYHKLYDILKQHQHEVNEIRAEKIARVANPPALVAQQQPVYQPYMVDEDDETSKDKKINKLMALISLSFKKIYKPTNNNLRASSNTSRANQDNSSRINRNAGYENQRIGNVAGARETVGSTVVQKSGIQCYNCKEFGHVARECQKPKRAKDVAYYREKMLLCKQEEAGIQLNAEQANWKDDTDDDELEDHELEVHYMYMTQLQQVSLDAADSGPIFDDEPLQKNDDDNDLAKERELLAFLIEKLKCEIDESKNHNKFLETSNKAIIEKLKGEIEDFKNKNKSLESSNNFFKEANNRLSETNNLLYADFKKSEAEFTRRNSKEYASQMELECAKVREIKDKLSAHQETISILSKQKEAQIKLYKTQEDKELDKVIELENKVKDKRLKDLMMMILVRQTEEYDIMFYTMKTDMVMLVAETEISHQLDISDKLTPFRRECIQKHRVDLELFQFHVIHVHFIQE
nr:hypothetical protein [Tanacetum cinerariifolium]